MYKNTNNTEHVNTINEVIEVLHTSGWNHTSLKGRLEELKNDVLETDIFRDKNTFRMEISMLELTLSILYRLNAELVHNFKEDQDNEEIQKILFSIKNTYEYINNKVKSKTWHEEEDEALTDEEEENQE